MLCSDALLQIIRGLEPIIPRSNFSDLLPEQLRELAKGSSSASPVRPNSEEPTAKRLLPLQEGLTRREAEIVDLLMQGLANKEIARRLDLAEGTVKVHVHNIFQKLAAANRLALLATAGRNSDKGRSEQSR